MFGIGFGEIVIVLLIAIVFIRPEDLPKFFARAGRLYGQIKKMYNEIIEVKDKIIKEIDSPDHLNKWSGGDVSLDEPPVVSNPAVKPKDMGLAAAGSPPGAKENQPFDA